MNKYDRFIAHLRKKEPAISASPVPLQKHRIIPAHQGGGYTQGNVVVCSLQDHIIAHSIRYECFGQIGDKFAVGMMTGRLLRGEKTVTTLGALATHGVCKRKKTGFWSSETQRENALKGNTTEVLKAKSVGGAKGNRIIRERGVGVYAPGQAQKSGRASALKRWGIKSQRYGRLYYNQENRVSISDTFFDYYVAFGNPWAIPSQASDASEEGVETSR